MYCVSLGHKYMCYFKMGIYEHYYAVIFCPPHHYTYIYIHICFLLISLSPANMINELLCELCNIFLV